MEDTRDKFKVAFRAINEDTKPKAKPAKEKKEERPLSNNPGYGYHGVLAKKHGDNTKAHAEFKKMHAKVKDLAGEAGHLTNSKKPNEMVRDYLDSKMGRHLEGYEEDPHYIKKSFGTFSRTYKPELFSEETLTEGSNKLVNVHVNWTGDWGSNSHFHKQFPSMKHAKKYTSDYEKKNNYRPVWTYETTNKIRESFDTTARGPSALGVFKSILEAKKLVTGDPSGHEKILQDHGYKKTGSQEGNAIYGHPNGSQALVTPISARGVRVDHWHWKANTHRVEHSKDGLNNYLKHVHTHHDKSTTNK